MLMVREAAARSPRGSIAESLRFQMLSGILLTVILPAAVRYYFVDSISPESSAIPGLVNSMIGATFAWFLGISMMRRVTQFPGTRSFGYVMPSFVTSYGLTLAIFFSLRLEYTRAYLVGCFVMAVLVAFASSLYLQRRSLRRFYVVPSGKTDFVFEAAGIEWIMLREPKLPDDRAAVIVADLRYDHDDEWERMLAEAAVQGHPVYHTKQLRESLTGRVSIEHLSENSFGSLLPNLAYRKLKRLIDLVACGIVLPFLLLPMMLVAIIVKSDSPGHALFRQQRMGFRGKPFSVYKFRTMRERSVGGGELVARADAMTLSDDDRITRVGRFLRRSRIDELPQVFNVIRGEMSWIGPRPEALALSNWYEAELPFYRYRHIVRPGITGWAQVNQGHVADLEAVSMKLHYDFYYIKNFSAWLDLLIAMRTVRIILTGFGSK